MPTWVSAEPRQATGARCSDRPSANYHAPRPPPNVISHKTAAAAEPVIPRESGWLVGLGAELAQRGVGPDAEPHRAAVAEQGKSLSGPLLDQGVDGGELPLPNRGGGHAGAVDAVGERFLGDLLLADQDGEQLQQLPVGG